MFGPQQYKRLIPPRSARSQEPLWTTTITTVTTTTTTSPVMEEDRVRAIIREEIAALPIRYDVPDTPPTD